MGQARYIVGDVLEVLRSLPDDSVDLVLTSPPFLALRSYLPADHVNKAKELGSEPTPGAFIDALLDVVEECARVLAPHGSLCIELGDTYAGSGGAGGDYNDGGLRESQPKFNGSMKYQRTHDPSIGPPIPRVSGTRGAPGGRGWPQDKSLTLVPELFRISLAYGVNPLTGRTTDPWRIRNVVRWVRPNPPVGCVDPETEALTPDGWKTQDQLEDGDLIAAYDPKSDSCRYLPAKFVRWHHEGEMVSIEKRSTSQLLTPDHRCWTRTPKLAPHVKLAGDLTLGNDTLLAAPFDDVPGNAPVTVERAALLGWFLAEGSQHHRQAKIVQSLTANPQRVDRIRALLDTDGADYRESVYRRAVERVGRGVGKPPYDDLVSFVIKGELAEWLNLHQKRLPMSYVTTWPEAQAQALFDALIDGDGHRRKIGRGHGLLFHQKAKPLCEAVQVLALRLGYRATLTYQPSMDVWQVTMGRNRWTKIRKWAGTGVPRAPYAGTVWCPQIETTFWLARRNGRTFVTGNSLGDKFRPATSEMVVATKSRTRYFDLDAVREPVVPGKTATRNGKWGTSDDESLSGRRLGTYTSEMSAGAPPLDWWAIPTEPFSGSHYATFPRELCVKPIRAMCPERVCRVCGEPSRRIVEQEPEYRAARDAMVAGDSAMDAERREARGAGGTSWSSHSGAASAIAHGKVTAAPRTVGWSDCGCSGCVCDDHPHRGGHQCARLGCECRLSEHWRPGAVLDPFAGSGTTGAVATGHGRDAVLIDIDERNADLARERIGLFLTVEDFNGENVA